MSWFSRFFSTPITYFPSIWIFVICMLVILLFSLFQSHQTSFTAAEVLIIWPMSEPISAHVLDLFALTYTISFTLDKLLNCSGPFFYSVLSPDLSSKLSLPVNFSSEDCYLPQCYGYANTLVGYGHVLGFFFLFLLHRRQFSEFVTRLILL